MSDIATVTRSLRTVRLVARLPRIAAAILALVFIVAGIRATFATPEKTTARPIAPMTTPSDQGAAAFAEGFARAYLSWDKDKLDERVQRLEPYLGALDGDAGVEPASGTSQQVVWATVVAERPEPNARLVTVAVQTTRQLVYLSVPVSRDKRGFLSINAYPALVGPPATNSQSAAPDEEAVDDDALVEVVTRAMRNYLAGHRENLLADLTPDALVSPPAERLVVADTNPTVTWVVPSRRVAVELDARDTVNTIWTLRYEVDVRKRERWYVHGFQVNPTFQGVR